MMGITTEEYRRYISDLDALKSGKALKNNYQKEQVTLTARKKQLIKQANSLKEYLDSGLEEEVEDRMREIVPERVQSVEFRIAILEQGKRDAEKLLNKNQRNYRGILQSNLDFQAACQEEREVYEEDMKTLGYMFPGEDVRARARALISSWDAPDQAFGYSLEELRKGGPVKPLESTGKQYQKANLLKRLWYLLIPGTYKGDLITPYTLKNMRLLTYGLSIIFLLACNLSPLPLLAAAVPIVLLLAVMLRYMGRLTGGNFNKCFDTYRQKRYNFIFASREAVERYTRASLEMPVGDVKALRQEIREAKDSCRQKTDILNERKELLMDTVVQLDKQLQAHMQEAQKLAEAEQGVRLSRALRKSAKERTDHENLIVSEHQEKIRAFQKTKSDLEGRASAARREYNEVTSRLESLPGELKQLVEDRERKIRLVQAAEYVYRGEEELAALYRQRDEAGRSSLEGQRAALRSQLEAKASQELRDTKRELKSIDSRLQELSETLEDFDAAMADRAAFCTELSQRMEQTPPPTSEETRGVFDSTCFLVTQKKTPYGPELCEFRHDGKPCILLYTLDSSVGNVGDVTAQLTPLLEGMITGFLTTNSFDSIGQTIVDTITGAKHFRSPELRPLISVCETPQEVQALAEKIKALTNQVIDSGEKNLDDLNRKRVDSEDMPIAHQVVYFILPPLDAAAGRSVISDDLLRSIRSGHELGFLPIFLLQEQDWEKYRSAKDAGRLSSELLSDLDKVVDGQHIFRADLAAGALSGV